MAWTYDSQRVQAAPVYKVWTAPDPVVADSTKVRDLHIEELRTSVNTELVYRTASAKTWTDPVLFNGADLTPTKVRTYHINELRQACETAQLTDCSTDTVTIIPPKWNNNPGEGPTQNLRVEDSVTKIRATHVNELRDYVNLLESACLCNCDNYCPCNCNDCGCNHCGSHCSPH